MKKRVLWLLNHTTLREFEVPLLVEMGYEVFCPKIFQVGMGDGSASITYEYDQTLSIPDDVLQRLNQVDFYESVPDDVLELMNEYFDIAMFHYFPAQFKMLVKSFRGVLVFQAFGLLQEAPYTQVILDDLGLAVLQQVKNLGNRFFFAQAYPHLKDVECRYFQQHSIDMPLGLKDTDRPKRWKGGDKRFLFVLPRIQTSGYFKMLYQKFQKDFDGMDYLISGAQPIAVKNDPHITGFLPKDEFDYVMDHCAAMYYHSTEKNHIHYHPFEAVRNGMPLVFMAGGMMDKLGGENLPGRCKTVREARSKLERLARGDRRLIRAIVESQDVLLKHFSYANCKEKWETGMEQVLSALQRVKQNSEVREKKIAVIMPQPYLGGVLDYTIRLAKCLVKGAEERGDKISVVLGYPENPVFEEKDYFKDLQGTGVSLRAFTWAEKPVQWMKSAYQLLDVPDGQVEGCCILDDNISLFEDCDYLIFTADRAPGPIYSTRPFVVVAHDYIQRYRAEMFGGYYEHPFIDFARRADAVFTTTPATTNDAIQYAGIKKENVILTPLMFDLLSVPEEREEEELSRELRKDYFLWSTNIALHKNHKKALQALSDYYHRGGKLRCIVTGVNTEQFNVKKTEKQIGVEISPYVAEIRKIISEDEMLKKNLVIKGNLPKVQYTKILQRAKFVFHPGYADNGNGTAIDAASLGVPTVCSDYPAMHYISDYTGINAHFFDPFDEDSICEALQAAENNYEEYAAQVPSRDELKQFTVDGTYREIYRIVRSLVGGLA